jgi:hypothetical protein
VEVAVGEEVEDADHRRPRFARTSWSFQSQAAAAWPLLRRPPPGGLSRPPRTPKRAVLELQAASERFRQLTLLSRPPLFCAARCLHVRSQVKSRVNLRGGIEVARSLKHKGLPGGSGLWAYVRGRCAVGDFLSELRVLASLLCVGPTEDESGFFKSIFLVFLVFGGLIWGVTRWAADSESPKKTNMSSQDQVLGRKLFWLI